MSTPYAFYGFIAKYNDIFCRKNEREAFALQKLLSAKASHIFSTKNIGIFHKLRFEILIKN